MVAASILTFPAGRGRVSFCSGSSCRGGQLMSWEERVTLKSPINKLPSLHSQVPRSCPNPPPT